MVWILSMGRNQRRWKIRCQTIGILKTVNAIRPDFVARKAAMTISYTYTHPERLFCSQHGRRYYPCDIHHVLNTPTEIPSSSKPPAVVRQKTLVPLNIDRCRCRYISANGVDVANPRGKTMQPGWSDRGPLRPRARGETIVSGLDRIVDCYFAISFYNSTLSYAWVLPLLLVRRCLLRAILLCRSSPIGTQVAKRPAMAMMASFVQTMLR
jgi:hypothetical protein